MESQEIRAKFLEFFEKKDHNLFRSDSLVPSNDPTLLFTSAGMVQFKDHYLGRNTDNVTRATTCQKCFRTTDIENVGYTARHHTFFEMLGNFSFGDYFKTEAIHWGWEFVTEVLNLDPERLYPTVFESDDEAFEIWEKEIGVPGSKIQRLGRKDNFWGPVGDRGPCGPCSEILYDQGSHIEDEDDRYLEIWNLVFPQFDAQPDGTFPELERKGIDTGAGLERIAAVMQGVDTNYETDLFRPYLRHLQEESGKKFGEDHETTCSMRVVADHCRATTFAITDKIVPSNVGRGYVLRRIMRRAMLHGQRLGLGQGFFVQTIPLVVEAMKDIYPDLVAAKEHVARVVESEEESFHRTLARGSSILGDLIEEMKSDGKTALSGEDAFRLYDTYGFPLELTMEVLTENGMTCSQEEFDEQMEEQRQRAKAAWKGSGMKGLAEAEGIESLSATDFVGYTQLESDAEAVYLFDGTSRVESLAEGTQGSIVLDRTPFYAESGGQVGDIGEIEFEGGSFRVTDTQKSANGVFLHQGEMVNGTLKVGASVKAKVDEANRRKTLPHHTGTHLLQAALQKVLGDHVHQQGSYVSPGNLRFDFSHTQGMTREEIDQVETWVNRWVLEDYPVDISHTTIDEAKAAGAMALFGEKYGEVVRMVSVEPVSRELCGGTHVNRTGEIGPFLVTSEESIQAGVRRITALAGEPAYQEIKKRGALLQELAAQLKCPLDEVGDRVEKLQSQLKEKDKQIKTLREKGGGISIDSLVSGAKKVELDGDSADLVAAAVEATDADSVESAVKRIVEKVPRSIVVLGAAIDGKVIFVCSVAKELTGKVKAGDLAREAATVVGGGGGGKPDWAKAGGKDPSKLGEAISKIEAMLGA